MADFYGELENGLSDQTVSGSRHTLAAADSNAYETRSAPADSITAYLMDTAIEDGVFDSTEEGLYRATPILDFYGSENPGLDDFWFEHLILWPAAIELGNVLTTITRDIEIFSSYRDISINITAATANAGTGVTLVGITVPVAITRLNDFVCQVRITTQGPPDIDGTLDFVSDVESLSIPITGTRLFTFAYQPEAPITEILEFKTDVIPAADGSEQRVSIRKNPRQLISMMIQAPEGPSRRKLMALLFNWHVGLFGLPIWFEARKLVSDAAIGATTIYVNTAYADYRVGSLVIIWQDEDTFDALEVSVVNADSLELSSGTLYAYTANRALVMPLRVAIADDTIGIKRSPVNLDQYELSLTVTDNQTDIADASAFSSYDGKVLLDDSNLLDGAEVPDDLYTEIIRIDNVVGTISQLSLWNNPRYVTRKGFFCNSRQQTWEVRQLLHALRGSQVSFWLPTFYEDIEITGNIVLGANEVEINNIGYTTHIQSRSPNNAIRIVLNDGTSVLREITGSSEVDGTTERLTVAPVWDANILASDINYVNLLRLSRIADDKAQFEHGNNGKARVFINVFGVQQ